MKSGEENEIHDLISQTFNQFIAYLYPQEGVEEFLNYIKPNLFIQRTHENHFVLIAKTQEKIIGMVEIRNHEHISLLFVSKEFQLRGISKEILSRSIEICHKNNPNLHQLTVNSSPNAIHIYEKLGFKKVGPEQLRNGIIFTPMVKEL